MVERAAAATPEELLSAARPRDLRDPVTTEPPDALGRRARPERGRARGRGRRQDLPARAGRWSSGPARTPTSTTACSTGARATIERIYIDYDGKVHLAVTVDDDPGQELMRETGRFLFFFAPEVEVVA